MVAIVKSKIDVFTLGFYKQEDQTKFITIMRVLYKNKIFFSVIMPLLTEWSLKTYYNRLNFRDSLVLQVVFKIVFRHISKPLLSVLHTWCLSAKMTILNPKYLGGGSFWFDLNLINDSEFDLMLCNGIFTRIACKCQSWCFIFLAFLSTAALAEALRNSASGREQALIH